MVVGINERTDADGNPIFHTQSISSDIGEINGRRGGMIPSPEEILDKMQELTTTSKRSLGGVSI